MKKTKLKKCNKCGREKAIYDFGKHLIENDGLQSVCRLCKSILYKEYKIKTDYNRKNYVRINATTRRIRHKYRDDWKQYFIRRYGSNPQCQLCDTELAFDIKGKAVCFDHRYEGQELIKGTPAAWYTSRPCTSENIQIFDSCDFGLLCSRCNNMLPTLNRDAWVEKLVKYNEETKTGFVN